MRITIGFALFAAFTGLASGQERLADGVALQIGERRLEVRVCRDDVVRVVFASTGPFFGRRSIVTVDGACRPTPFDVHATADVVALTTKRLVARIATPSGAVIDRSLNRRPSGVGAVWEGV
jgi:hypothetical protein